MNVKDEAFKAEAQRVLEEIRRLIQLSDLSQREVEKRVGFSRGYLSQLLARNVDLKYWHLMAILRVLNYAPRRFFAEVYAEPYDSALETFKRKSRPPSGELGSALEQLYPDQPESIRRLQQRIERCEKAIAELQRRGGPRHGR